MTSLNIGDLPSELTSNPLGFVAIFGLDVSNNPVHAAIWDSFSASRQERTPLYLQYLQDDHVFPEAKPKRTSYEWYVPKGILKTNWMRKHLTEVPAVAVQFIDLDWDDPHWSEKRTECENKLDQLRSSLQHWGTKVALVLIQKRAALPGTEDQVAAERAASLCTACNLSAKTLFVLPHSDHLFGYTLRLQTALHELTQTYYHLECRRIRNHREFLNKTNHQLLFVRHQFKIAFLSELKQDTNSALKNYKQAYANLMEVRASDANMLEIKTVAGFINYKICKLSFLNSTPLDAIAQFRKHVDIFKNKVGTQDLTFEHSAWMSKQFSHFGDLFEDAVQQGLNAIQTQHPGFYYQQAANHAICRKQLCYKLCQGIKEANLAVLEGADTLEFYGQRPWRPCSQSLEPSDPQKEQEGILALKYQELNEVNHSMIIIPLLSSAVAQFKKYKCPRMKRQLTVEMGEEYYLCKDYSKALTLLKHVLWDYRIEKWRPIVSSILSTTLKCAFFSANVQDYISLGLESISNWVLCTYEEKANVQVNINNLVQGKPPYPLSGANDASNKATEKLWLEALGDLEKPTIFTVQMASIIPFVECKAGFSSKNYFVDQRVTVTVYLRMNCPQPMTFSKLSVLYNNPKYNNVCELPMVNAEGMSKKEDSNGKCNIYLIPRNTHTFTFTFIPDPEDIGKDIQITSIALQLGSEKLLCAVLHWMVTGADAVSTQNHSNPFVTKAFSFSDDPSFQHLPVQPSTSILPRDALVRIEISHEPPALIDEFYAFTLNITNEEIANIDNVHLSAMLKEDQEQLIYLSTHLTVDPCCVSKNFVQFLGNIPLEDMVPGENIKKTIYMKATEVAARKLVFQVTYEIKVEVDEQSLHCFCKKAQELEVNVIEPFEFSVKLMNMKFELQESVRAEDPFLVKVDIVSCSPLPLMLEGGVLELSHHFKKEDQDITTCVANVPLTFHEAATECFCLITPLECPSSIPVGSYCLKWKRNSDDQECTSVETEINLQTLDVTREPIYMELDCPAHGWVRTPMTIIYHLYNRLFTVQDIELLIDSSDAFMYAGNKQLHMKILPREKCALKYNLYPLVPGYVPLPRIRIILNPGRPNALALDELVHSMTTSHIFVMPQGKSNGTDPARTV